MSARTSNSENAGQSNELSHVGTFFDTKFSLIGEKYGWRPNCKWWHFHDWHSDIVKCVVTDMLLQLAEADSVSQCAFGPNGIVVTSATGTLRTAQW